MKEINTVYEAMQSLGKVTRRNPRMKNQNNETMKEMNVNGNMKHAHHHHHRHHIQPMDAQKMRHMRYEHRMDNMTRGEGGCMCHRPMHRHNHRPMGPGNRRIYRGPFSNLPYEHKCRVDALPERNHREDLTVTNRPEKDNRHMMNSVRLLSVIAKEENITAGNLAEILDIRPSTLSEKLARLEKEELITRTKNENDSRITNINITEKGSILLEEKKNKFMERFNRYESALTEDEKAEFIRLTNKILESIEG